MILEGGADETRPELGLDRRPRQRSGLLEESVGEELLVYDPQQGEAFTLNRSARAVWALCDGSRAIREIAAVLADWTQLPADELAHDVRSSVRELDELGLLEPELPEHHDDPT
jgi:hypothetical protein